MGILIGLSLLFGLFVLIWLMRFRRWKSWSLMLAFFVVVVLVFHLKFNGPLEVDEAGTPIIKSSMIYSGVVIASLAICLLVSAISLLLDTLMVKKS